MFEQLLLVTTVLPIKLICSFKHVSWSQVYLYSTDDSLEGVCFLINEHCFHSHENVLSIFGLLFWCCCVFELISEHKNKMLMKKFEMWCVDLQYLQMPGHRTYHCLISRIFFTNRYRVILHLSSDVSQGIIILRKDAAKINSCCCSVFMRKLFADAILLRADVHRWHRSPRNKRR